MVSYQEFQKFISQLPPDVSGNEEMRRILAFGKDLVGDHPFVDDFSVLKIIFGT